MADAELLKKIKNGLGIYTNFQDETLKEYISEVQEYMRGAGVSEEVLNSSASVGAIRQGVNDLWNYTAGGVKFSPYFHQRVLQLRRAKAPKEEAADV